MTTELLQRFIWTASEQTQKKSMNAGLILISTVLILNLLELAQKNNSITGQHIASISSLSHIYLIQSNGLLTILGIWFWHYLKLKSKLDFFSCFKNIQHDYLCKNVFQIILIGASPVLAFIFTFSVSSIRMSLIQCLKMFLFFPISPSFSIHFSFLKFLLQSALNKHVLISL